MEPTFTISHSAQLELLRMLQEQKNSKAKIRIYIRLTVSKGWEYAMTIDEELNDDDLVFTYLSGSEKLEVMVDAMSIQYLKGATIDIKENSGQRAITITNPNALKK